MTTKITAPIGIRRQSGARAGLSFDCTPTFQDDVVGSAASPGAGDRRLSPKLAGWAGGASGGELNDPGTTTAPRIIRQFAHVSVPSSFFAEHRAHFHWLAIARVPSMVVTPHRPSRAPEV